MAAARDGLLPRFLAKLSRHQTPYWSIILSSLIMTVLLGMNYSELLTSQITLLITLDTDINASSESIFAFYLDSIVVLY